MAMIMMMAKSMAKSMRTEQNMPWASTLISSPMAMDISHGMGNLERGNGSVTDPARVLIVLSMVVKTLSNL